MAKQTETKIIKETSYCKIYNKVSIEDDDYYSCIERIEVKEKSVRRYDLHCTKIQ